MEITFKGRQTDVAARFRDQATAKLMKLEKLDQKAIRVDVEVSVERNPRQSSQKERVELTIISRGPAVRAEAAAEDRFAALDLALAKLDSRLRRALDRRKRHNTGQRPVDGQWPVDGQLPQLPAGSGSPDVGRSMPGQTISRPGKSGSPDGLDPVPSDSVVPIEMEGDGPLVVRQKVHHAAPIPIDQALLEMELVGHDFYLFYDVDEDMPSVVYRRRGYQYGVIRLVESRAEHAVDPDSGSGAAARPVAVPASRRPARSEVADGDLAGQRAAMPSVRSS
jgi:ribosomal subunit interface protein